MSDNPTQPEGEPSAQDMDLEAQLDHLLNELEEVEPNAIPVDMRKNEPPEPPESPEPVPAEPEHLEPEPVAAEPMVPEAAPETVPPEAGADAQTVEPVAVTSETAEAAASETPTEQGLDTDTIAAMASDLLDSQIDSTIEAASVEAVPEEPAATPEAAEVPQAAQASETVQPDPVPVDAGPEPEPIKPLSDDQLASQLDSLLTEVQNPTATPAEPVAESPVSESAEAQEVAAQAVTESNTPEPVKSLSEDDLANQLDSLLAEVQNPGAATESVGETANAVGAAGEAAAESDTTEPAKSLTEDDLASQLDSLLTQVQNPTSAVEAASTDEPKAEAAEADIDSVEPAEVVAGTDVASGNSSEDAGSVSIDQIDAMLAETAEQAIEHGPVPETDIPPGTDEVLAAQAMAEQDAEARAQADRDAAEPVPVSAEAVSAPEPEPVPVPAPVDASEPEPLAVEPQPVPVEAGAAAAGGASAADVANELDNDAQASGQPDDGLTEAAFAEPFQCEDGSEAFDDEQVQVNHSGLKKAEFALLMICSKINKPLNRLSPEMRDSVGYAGLATTGLAFFMLIYGVLF